MDHNKRTFYLEKLNKLNPAEKNFIVAALEQVKTEGISNYPILIVFEKNLSCEIGIPLSLQDDFFEYNISTLEELFVKNIVNQEKVNNFRDIFNHKIEHICVLIISDGFSDIVFLPG